MRLPKPALRVFDLLAFNHEWIRMGATIGAIIGAIIDGLIDTSLSNAAVD